ncbi:MAG: DUF2520 domain-containing protein [Acidobacteriia bacterium]|nr:DUF2520 domain-containing protein [Terriglobia bacterium]MYG04831.1 DUF2520 domain-containing protein [Terriglobia bacterium]MYK11562.1 DUF2520 domain-containing protein [Terriglobia bacterium]
MSQGLTVGIVGAGSVGQALARLLAADFDVIVSSRSRARAAGAVAGIDARAATLEALASSSDCVIVAVPDRAVPEVVAELARFDLAAALQTSGALGPASLAPLRKRGVPCAMFHPLQTFPTPDAGAQRLPGSLVGVCGDDRALAWCEGLAVALRCTTFKVAEDQLAQYHAAAVLASNCVVGLVDAAATLMEGAGVERMDALRALRPLLDASLENASTMEANQALTGPIARGDAVTVRRHLGSMRNSPTALVGLYRACGEYLLNLAQRRGLSDSQATAVRSALSEEC